MYAKMTSSLENQCEKCPDNCLHCDYDLNNCSACIDGYGLEINDENMRTGQCSKCNENCLFCAENSKVCTMCDVGFGFAYEKEDSNSIKCEKCPDNCIFNILSEN